MAGSSSPRSGEMIVGINVTPMVDIVLVLLIILMVTASYTISQSVPINLPRAESGEALPQTPLFVAIDQAGKLYLDGHPSDEQALRVRVRQQPDVAETRVVIAADGDVPHRHVVRLMDLFRTEKVTRFAFNVAPEELP